MQELDAHVSGAHAAATAILARIPQHVEATMALVSTDISPAARNVVHLATQMQGMVAKEANAAQEHVNLDVLPVSLSASEDSTWGAMPFAQLKVLTQTWLGKGSGRHVVNAQVAASMHQLQQLLDSLERWETHRYISRTWLTRAMTRLIAACLQWFLISLLPTWMSFAAQATRAIA